MIRVTYIDHDGKAREVEARPNFTVMEAATKNGVPGIDADCGGACACATCHVYVDESWSERVGPPNGPEAAMLDFAENVRPNSRLSCQIRLTELLNGVVVRTPQSQQ